MGILAARNLYLADCHPKGVYFRVVDGKMEFGLIITMVLVFLVPLYFLFVVAIRQSGWSWKDSK